MLVTPGSTTTRWLSRSTSSTRFRRVSAISTPSSAGSAPPDRPEPAPRATNGTPASWQARTMACTSSADPGSTTAPGVALKCMSPSDSYVRSASRSVTTCSEPLMRAICSTRSPTAIASPSRSTPATMVRRARRSPSIGGA